MCTFANPLPFGSPIALRLPVLWLSKSLVQIPPFKCHWKQTKPCSRAPGLEPCKAKRKETCGVKWRETTCKPLRHRMTQNTIPLNPSPYACWPSPRSPPPIWGLRQRPPIWKVTLKKEEYIRRSKRSETTMNLFYHLSAQTRFNRLPRDAPSPQAAQPFT